MRFFKNFPYLLILSFCLNCNNKINDNSIEISLINFGNVDKSKIEFIKSTLEEKFKIDTIIEFNQELPKETFYEPRNRYRADKLIKYLKETYPTEKVIGISNKDISTTVHQHEDWGIMGLAYCPGKSCVVSTFRIFRNAKSESHKNERLKKIIVHEFGHTLGLQHCKNDKTCLMLDANGKVSTIDETDDFCNKCELKIKKYLKS